MWNKPMLGVDQAQAAIKAMIDDFNKDPNRRAVDMSVVDDAGNLIAYARMDKCLRPSFGGNKAYTAAIRGMDSVAFGEQLKSSGRNIADFSDPRLVVLQGGLVVRSADGAVLGGIGVGGLPSGKDDEDIARAGLKALNL